MLKIILTLSLFLGIHNLAQAFSWPGTQEAKAWPSRGFRSLFQETHQYQVNAEANWSGAHWNYKTQTLWLCRNKWGVRAYKYNTFTKNFVESKRFKFEGEKSFDFESITQEDLEKDIFLLLNEKRMMIQEFDLSGDKPKLLGQWKIKHLEGAKKKASFEGMMFVPNSELKRQNFVDGKGQRYEKAKNGGLGLLFVSDQKTGDIFALDLGANGTYTQVGLYFLPLDSTRGLEFDRQGKYSYAIDGAQSAKFKLSSVATEKNGREGRSFTIVKLFEGPGPDAAEGIAIAPGLLSKGKKSVFVTDDDNLKGVAAVRWYDIIW